MMFPTFSNDEKKYKKALINRVQYIIESSHKLLSLYEIIQLSAGASPSDVIQILDEFNLPYFTNEYAGKINIKSNLKGFDAKYDSSIFAAPHPADYDWRFNERTINKIVLEIDKYSSTSSKEIALFGVHTLYIPLVNLSFHITLFNKSRSLLDDLQKVGYKNGLVEFDLFNPILEYKNRFDTVIADPPWYIDFYKAFILRSAEALKMGKNLLISVLPELTRPSASQDQEEIKRIAYEFGFDLIHIEKSFFQYETPEFEQIALRSQGLYCIDWRLGDLWIFQKKRHSATPFVLSHPNDEPTWREFRIGKRKIKVKIFDNEASFFDYEFADPTNRVFANVSRRSPIRHRIDVWTSDNLAYRVTQVSALLTCLSILERNGTSEEINYFLSNSTKLSDNDKIKLLSFLDEIS